MDDAERVLKKILDDPTLDIVVNVGGYLVAVTMADEWGEDWAIIDLTKDELALCQRLQESNDG